MNKTLDQTWDMNAIFDGGSESDTLHTFIQSLEKDITDFAIKLTQTKAPETIEEALKWQEQLDISQSLAARASEAGAFISCLNAQDVKDQKAKQLTGKIRSIYSRYSSCMTSLDDQILHMPQHVWDELLQQEQLQRINFPLNERREQAKEKLPPDQEALINTLMVDGYHGWGELYDTIVANIKIDYEDKEAGKQELSVGQADNRMSSGDRSVRQSVFEKWEAAWANQADFCAAALNHLAGFRINVYEQRGWDDILKEPLEYNRMSQETLDTMWAVITKHKDVFTKFLARKADLLNIERLSWHDVEAPLGQTEKKVTYDEACAFIIEQFNQFNPQLAEFAKKAIEDRWIEAEDRPNKRPGGFCTSFSLSEQSRIFMTFGGSASNISTLAHELGHAYHQHVMNDLPEMAQNYAMNVAETASTFAEMICVDAAVKSAEDREERLTLLEDKIQRSVAFFMNIHARFLFETRFYEERKSGTVSVDRLNELMLAAQKTAFCDSLEEYHPQFWQSKLHFYITGVPFYNFPYTFGYLFSTGVYARALKEGPAFAEKYDDLLRDTGSMTVEALATKHLGVDLTKPEFWEAAMKLAIDDVEEFMRLSK